MQWEELSEVGQIEKIIQTSSSPEILAVVIFKHSTRCSISSMAKSRLERKWKLTPNAPFYYLDLISHRDVSQAVAERFQVKHESPQILLIKDGKCFFHNSHGDISAEAIEMALGGI